MSSLTPHTFFFELPLYTSIDVNDQNIKEFKYLMSAQYAIDAYNPTLKQESTYRIKGSINYKYDAGNLSSYSGFNQYTLTCVRNGHTISIFTNVQCDSIEDEEDQYTLFKVGQYPSIADLHISKIRNYDKVL